MSLLRIADLRIVTPERTVERGTLLLRDGKIEAVRSRVVASESSDETVIDGRGLTALPGFIDPHIHGGGGADTMDANAESLRTICRTHARHGTTGLLLTTMTQSRLKITAALDAVRQAARQGMGFCPDGAAVLGLHLEGPYISAARPGAQPKEFVRSYEAGEFAEWVTVADGTMRMITLAPEEPKVDELIRICRENGIVISMGHTDADSAQTVRALASGVSHATHLFNAMPSIHHRKPGPIPVLLSDDRATVEIIADGQHLALEVIEMVLAAKGTDRVVLITDAMAGAGAPDGVYGLGGNRVTVADGRAVLDDGTLAGSVLTMDVAVRNIRRWCGLDWQAIVKISSANAAQEFGLSHKGSLIAGNDADVVLVDEDCRVQYTFVGGRCVYRSDRNPIS